MSGYSSAVGKPAITATAKDGAGNTATKTGASYTVQAWTTKGFFQPVDMGGTPNSAKAGSTIPVKFELFGATELTDVTAVQSIKYRSISCSSLSGAADEIEALAAATGGTALRYDATAGQYVYNWKTPAAGCCPADDAHGSMVKRDHGELQPEEATRQQQLTRGRSFGTGPSGRPGATSRGVGKAANPVSRTGRVRLERISSTRRPDGRVDPLIEAVSARRDVLGAGRPVELPRCTDDPETGEPVDRRPAVLVTRRPQV